MRDRSEDRWAEGWNHCKTWIENRLGEDDAAAWLSGLRLDDLKPHRIVLGGIPNSFCKNRIASLYQPLILEGLRSGYPEISFAADPVFEFRVESGWPGAEEFPTTGNALAMDANAGPGTAPGEGSAIPEDGPDGSLENPSALASRHTFDAFIPDAGNRSALQFARTVASQPGRRFNPFVLVGGTGVGKTHLMQAIGNALTATLPPGKTVRYRTGEEFKNEVFEGISKKRMARVREAYRGVEVLLLDVFQYLPVSPTAQEELLHTLDHLHRQGKQLVFSADRYPRALPNMGEALGARLEMGLIAEMLPPGEETRRRLAAARAKAEGFTLPESVAEYLAARITASVRQLEGAVVRLGAYAGLYGNEITEAFAERIAAPFFDFQPGGGVVPPARDIILERVAKRFGITVRALKGRERGANIVNARRIAIHLLKYEGQCSYPQIGTLLGNRTHSTVLHSHHILMEGMRGDERLRHHVMKLARDVAAEQEN